MEGQPGKHGTTETTKRKVRLMVSKAGKLQGLRTRGLRNVSIEFSDTEVTSDSSEGCPGERRGQKPMGLA